MKFLKNSCNLKELQSGASRSRNLLLIGLDCGSVHGERYLNLLQGFLWHQLEYMDELWFQQDAATCHTAGALVTLLVEKFPKILIIRRSDIKRLAILPILTFFSGNILNRRSMPANCVQLLNWIMKYGVTSAKTSSKILSKETDLAALVLSCSTPWCQL